MNFQMKLEGDGADEELRSLYTWLLDDSNIRRLARPELRATAPRPGDMGANADFIYFTVTTGLTLTQMIGAYLAWRKTRRRQSGVTIERDGTSITLSSIDEESIRAAVRALEGE
ncbi:effector-associated constant component EACC1 [Streptomyces olindensis]|uniref:effector-associated constant component EACC1 n=1 Tax=Streptomyces olindensis TaxID=358823 RepID=UPI0036627119